MEFTHATSCPRRSTDNSWPSAPKSLLGSSMTIDNASGTKLCHACGDWKPATAEHYYPATKGGFLAWCRPCRKLRASVEYKRAQPPKSPPEKLPSGMKRCRDCREIKATSQFYASPECAAGVRPECRRCLLQGHSKKGFEQRRAFRSNPKGKRKRCPRCEIKKPRTAQYFYVNPLRKDGFDSWCRPCNREYQNQLNKRPEQRRKRRSIKLNRQANMRGASGYVSPATIDGMMIEQNGQCHWCQATLSDYHVDHVIPVSRGGPHVRDNLVLSCPPCNFSKSNKMPWDWRPDLYPAPT